MPYRNEVEAAHARIAQLEAAHERLERENERLGRALKAPSAPRSRNGSGWLVALALVVATLGAAVLGLVSPSASARTPHPITARPSPANVAPPSTPAIEDAPTVTDATPIAAAPAPAPRPVRPDFYGQYWEARVTRTGPDGPPVGTECLITLNDRPSGDAGIATVYCGDELIHAAAVSPPSRGEARGFCWFSGTDLYCAPPSESTQVCWINTAGHVANCRRDIDLYIHTIMRDPNVLAPPLLAADPS